MQVSWLAWGQGCTVRKCQRQDPGAGSPAPETTLESTHSAALASEMRAGTDLPGETGRQEPLEAGHFKVTVQHRRFQARQRQQWVQFTYHKC